MFLLVGVLCSFALGVFDSMDKKVNTVSFSCVSRGNAYQKIVVVPYKVIVIVTVSIMFVPTRFRINGC